MKLASEKLSPIPGRAIFLTNFHVVTKTLALPAGLWLVVTSEEFNTQMVVGFTLWVYGLVGFVTAWRHNSAIRKLKYAGVLGFLKSNGDNPRWVSTLSPRTRRSPMRNLGMAVLISELLAHHTDGDDEYAQIAFGRGENNELLAKLVHHCDGNCSKPEIHLFGYDEDRDGMIHWT